MTLALFLLSPLAHAGTLDVAPRLVVQGDTLTLLQEVDGTEGELAASIEHGSESLTLEGAGEEQRLSFALAELPSAKASVSLNLGWEGGQATLKGTSPRALASTVLVIEGGSIEALGLTDVDFAAACGGSDETGWTCRARAGGLDPERELTLTLVVAEVDEGCSTSSKVCLPSTSTTKASLSWEAAVATWTGALDQAPDKGKLVLRSDAGQGKSKTMPTWADAGLDEAVVPVDTDLFTTLSLRANGEGGALLAISSGGWTVEEAPGRATLSLDNGESVVLAPMASVYQGTVQVAFDKDPSGVSFTLTAGECTVDGGEDLRFESLEDELEVGLSCRGEGEPGDLSLTSREGGPLGGLNGEPEWEEKIVEFGVGFSPTADPTGQLLAGGLKLEGPADTKGKRTTLVSGSVAAQVDLGRDGQWVLAMVDGTQDYGDILLMGEPIEIE